MQTALKIEMLKTKSSNYLKITLFLPMIFFLFTLMTLLSSKNQTGLIDGISIIQTSIFNLWTLILLPVCIVAIISSDYQQESKSLGWQRALTNNWSVKYIYIAKSFKFCLLVLLSQLTLVVVVCVSNLLTTKSVGNVLLLLCTSLVMWIGSWPLIVINMQLLHYLNAIIVSIINLVILMGSTFSGMILTPWFWLNPWVYALRTATLLRINPNGTPLASNSTLTTDTSFIYWILIAVIVWLIINYFLSVKFDRKVA